MNILAAAVVILLVLALLPKGIKQRQRKSSKEELTLELYEQLKAQQLVKAIKACRALTGYGLADAKELTESLAHELKEGSLTHSNLLLRIEEISKEAREIDLDKLAAEVCHSLKQNRNIEAIKRVRNASKLGLKEAKQVVDTLQEEVGTAPYEVKTVTEKLTQLLDSN